MAHPLEQRKMIVNPAEKKELWEHFKPLDLKALGAYVKGFQIMGFNTTRVKKVDGEPTLVSAFEPAPYFVNTMSKAKRPWSSFERLMAAIRTFTENKKNFDIAKYDTANNRVSSDTILHPDEIKESKEIFDKIIAWDEEYLDELVDEFGDVLIKMGFKKAKPADIAPFEQVRQTSDIEMALKDVAARTNARALTSAIGTPVKTIKDKILDILADGPAERKEIVKALVAAGEVTLPASMATAISAMVKDGVLTADMEAGTVSIAK